MDFNLVDIASEQAAKTEALEHAAAEYLFNKFDWKNRISEVTEELSLEPKTLDNALAAFMQLDSLTLRLTLEKVAMAFSERSARILVAKYQDGWRDALEEPSYD